MTTYVIVDLETTGLDPDRNAIIEFAALVLEDGVVLDEFSTLIHTHDPVTAEIEAITGISQKMVDEAPTLFSQRAKIRKLLSDHPIVGHNVRFDISFLRRENLGLDNPTLDTVTLASILLPGLGRYGLAYLAQELRLPLPPEGQAHRAGADAELTAELLLALHEKAGRMDVGVLSEIVETGSRVNWTEAIFFEDVLRTAARTAFSKGGKRRGRHAELFNPGKIEGRQLVPREEVDPIPGTEIVGMFNEGGNFSRVFEGFEYRPQQVEMVQAVVEAFNNSEHLLIEAGTGTGKSVGYLLPAAFWAAQNGRRVVVSTNTINLQDQLVQKDIPTLQKALPFALRAAVRKGRRNYICTRLFQQLRHRGVASADEMPLFARMLTWLPQTETGDVNELTLRGFEERMAWSRMSAENDVCTQDMCVANRCPRYIAQRRAENAHIVIVNHSLLLSDVANENHILPEFHDLIVDEAHHLEPAVTSGLSFEADRRILERVIADIIRNRSGLLEELTGRTNIVAPTAREELDGLVHKVREAADLGQTRVAEFFDTIAFFLAEEDGGRKEFAQQIRLLPAVRAKSYWTEIEESWANLYKPLVVVAKGLQKMGEQLQHLGEHFEIDDVELLHQSVSTARRSVVETAENIQAIIAEPSDEYIYWVELYKDRVSIHAAPLHVGPLVEEYLFHEKETVVLTSATMRTAPAFGRAEPNFDYIRDRLHAREARELAVGSPFDYKANALLYLVSDMPEPRQPGYQRFVEQAVIDTAGTLNGRTMVLFTSYRQLKETYAAVRGPLRREGIEVLAQLEGSSRQQITAQFKAAGARAVLLGTKSFWEGVDVPGEALQAVLLVRIPFDVPSDPIFSARSETFDNSFFDYSVPEAILRWRQGFGRLIRRQTDEGVVLVLDKRVISKRYGTAFVESLPNCTVIRRPADQIPNLLVRWFNRDPERVRRA